jgi:hypothetical protein
VQGAITEVALTGVTPVGLAPMPRVRGLAFSDIFDEGSVGLLRP